MKAKRYDELQIGDEVIFHGNNVRIVDIKRMPYTEEAYKDECTEVIAFTIEPADDEALEMMGSFYAHGTYSGVGCLTVGVRE